MNVARLMYPVKTLGPGNRLGIWLCGCNRHCIGCSNPELWQKKPEYEISVNDLLNMIDQVLAESIIEGITVSGGEPMDQSAELEILLKRLSPLCSDILIYTGYRMEELLGKHCKSIDAVIHAAAVIVDGPYMEDQNPGRPMIGSLNQRVIIVNPDFEDRYRDYLVETSPRIQNFAGIDSIYSVGIHKADYAAELKKRIETG